MRILLALAAGGVFGLGLVVSGMTDPAKVLGFLDITGDWDPTLAFVMGGAVAVMAGAWALAARRAEPWQASAYPPRPKATIDARLVGGAALFGAGWGLVGLCPGPALASLSFGGVPVWIFTAAMVAGMVGHGLGSVPGMSRGQQAAGDR